MIMCAQRQHGRRAAHVLLHEQHAAVGLDVEPAGVEAHALADQRHLRIARPCPSAARSGAARARIGGAADRVDQREVLLRAGRRRRSSGTSAPCRLASARAAASSSAGPMSLAGVLIRSRASDTPSAMRVTSSPSTPSGQHELDRLVLRLAVAREAIGAEREGQRGKARIVRRVGEAVGAGRQRARQQARQERIAVRACRSPDRTARRRSAAIRCRPGAGSKPAVLTKARSRAARPADDLRKLAAVTNQIGCAVLLRATR